MRSFRATLVSMSSVLILVSLTSARADEQPQQTAPAPKKFQLEASMMAKPQLSRSEIDPSAMGSTSMPPRAAVAPVPPSATAPPDGNAAGRLAALAAQARFAALQAQAQTQSVSEDDRPGAFMKEYNVDWSRWVGIVADRWFYVLRSAEYGMGVQFRTERPALIQFTCYADGSIGNIALKQSSGVPAYDRLQIAALLHAMPTPPFPPGTHRKSITLIQGWESHLRQPGEDDFQPGSFGKDFPLERVRKWCAGL